MRLLLSAVAGLPSAALRCHSRCLATVVSSGRRLMRVALQIGCCRLGPPDLVEIRPRRYTMSPAWTAAGAGRARLPETAAGSRLPVTGAGTGLPVAQECL